MRHVPELAGQRLSSLNASSLNIDGRSSTHRGRSGSTEADVRGNRWTTRSRRSRHSLQLRNRCAKRAACSLPHMTLQEVAKTRNDPQNASDRVHPLPVPLCLQSLKPADRCQQEW